MARPRKVAVESEALNPFEKEEIEASNEAEKTEVPHYNSDLMTPSEFTGEAMSLICYDNNGFRNFKLVKLKLQAGKVIEAQYGDPYASFEAGAFLELMCNKSVIKANNQWSHGKSWVLADGKF